MNVGCSFSQLNIVGIEGPKISASIKPTFAPIFDKPTAILEEIVDFPTPPFPDVMAIIFLIFLTILFLSNGITFEVKLILYETSLFIFSSS